MKAFLTVLALSFVIGLNGAYAQQAQHGADQAGGPQATPTMHHDEAGTVTYRGHLGGKGGDGEDLTIKIGPAH